MDNLDINRLRLETPACADLIHLNNAGASLSPQLVTDAVFEHLLLEQRIGGYEAQTRSVEKADNFYHAFARLLNCNPREIAYAESASRAWSLLFQALPFEPGDRILTCQSEYVSNYLALMHAARHRNITIDVVDNDENGQIDLQQLKRKIDGDVRLIALTHVPSQCGTIQPVEEVGHLARKNKIFYLLDACQAVGQINLDVNRIGCDMLTGTGRKFLRGPRGTGFMYVRNTILEYLEPKVIDSHAAQWLRKDQYVYRDDARRFELWETYVAGKIGLGVAADYAHSLGMPAVQNRIQMLATLLRDQLRAIPKITVHDLGNSLSGIVTFSKEDEAAEKLQKRLQAEKINSSVARRGNALLDFERRQLGDINRASLHYYNTEEEIERFCAVLSQ